jgi:hypothetical protein
MNPYLFGLYAWRETTTLHVTFKKVVENNSREDMVNLKGELCISMVQLLKSIISLEGNERGRFVRHLLHNLLRTYFLQYHEGVTRTSPYQIHMLNLIQAAPSMK